MWRSDSREAICADTAAMTMVALCPAGSCFERSIHAVAVASVCNLIGDHRAASRLPPIARKACVPANKEGL